MKTISLIILMASTLFMAKAAVLTVSNDPNQPAQFSTIAAAIDSAKAGDTIYISGSNVAYPLMAITKSNLTFIGTGFNPDKQNPFISKVEGATFTGSQNQLFENIHFVGIDFFGNLYIWRQYFNV
jgi:ABC-type phosphate transport system substrate-binding protein